MAGTDMDVLNGPKLHFAPKKMYEFGAEGEGLALPTTCPFDQFN